MFIIYSSSSQKYSLEIELKALFVTATVILLTCSLTARSQEVVRKSLPTGHPLIGAWRIDIPGTQCHEIYDIKQDGTMSVTSGAQAAESEFELDVKPSSNGFYKWVDKILKDNGKPDCMGEIMQAGHVATNYIILNRAGREFLMCEQERLSSCLGPFRRQDRDT